MNRRPTSEIFAAFLYIEVVLATALFAAIIAIITGVLK